MFGLIASATHLGNASNAPYVLSRVGASPLSTEVFCAAAFLVCASLFWMLGFAVRERRGLVRLLIACAYLTGALFLAAMSFAYDVGTIPTWSLPVVPASVVVSGALGGPLIALACLRRAGWSRPGRRFGRVLAAVPCAACIVLYALYAVYGSEALGMGNALFSAAEVVPGYWLVYALSAALALASVLVPAAFLFRGMAPRARLFAACAAGSLVAVFAMRFMFYMLHMTVGVAL